MARTCPICPRQPLTPVQASDVEVDLCPRCQGMWFDAGELELFPGRPSAQAFLAEARLAPGRCRSHGHRVPKGMGRCPQCGSGIAPCPSCGEGLSLVATPACAIDVCTACSGVWLDRGELEALEGVEGPTRASERSPSSEWEIPAPAPMTGPDPWSAPGSTRALEAGRTRTTSLACHHCGAVLSIVKAFSFEGDLYCAACRPAGAVSGAELPVDRRWDDPRERASAQPYWPDLVRVLLRVLGR